MSNLAKGREGGRERKQKEKWGTEGRRKRARKKDQNHFKMVKMYVHLIQNWSCKKVPPDVLFYNSVPMRNIQLG